MTSDVLVTGDATLDWHVLRAGAGASSPDAAAHARMLVEPGGAPLLARLIDHERWSNLKVAAGWEYATETDKPGKRHRALRPWSELPDKEREKDAAGYTIARAAE